MSTLAQGLPPGVNLTAFDIWGPITIGVLIGVFGMGILLMQTIAYLDSSPSDSSYLRGVIFLILGLNIGQTLSDCSRLIKIDVWFSGDIAYLFAVRTRPEEIISPSFSLIICTIAQIFLLRRCIVFARLSAPANKHQEGDWRRNARIGWRVVLSLGIGMSFICGTVSIVGLGQFHSLVEASRVLYPSTLFARWSTAWLGTTSATDISLSTTLLWELRSARKLEETSRKGKRAIRAMIRVAWSNGILVGVLQLVSLFFLMYESSSWADFAQIFISKAYSITLLASITSPISALRGTSQSPNPIPARQAVPLATTPLPMLYMNKNPSAEWSPYSASPTEMGVGSPGMNKRDATNTITHIHPHTPTPYPLRNAEIHSAEYARGAGRARLNSKSSSSEWGRDVERGGGGVAGGVGGAGVTGLELRMGHGGRAGEENEDEDGDEDRFGIRSNRSSGVLGLEMDSPASQIAMLQTPTTPPSRSTREFPNPTLSAFRPDSSHSTRIPNLSPSPSSRWRGHTFGESSSPSPSSKSARGKAFPMERPVLGRSPTMRMMDSSRSFLPSMSRKRQEEFSMDDRCQGGEKTFGSVGGAGEETRTFGSVGEAV